MRVKVVAIIPARIGSHRFPGKPLVEVRGLPMIEHVRRRALLCRRFSEVVVATCDPEIAAVVKENRGKVLMTSPKHEAATDRVAEAAERLRCSHVVNIQGDEILVLPSDLERMASAIEGDPSIPAWNALFRIERREELEDPSVVKCVVSTSGRILFCSRDFSRLPMKRDNGFEPVFKILGILGYRRDFLQRYGQLPRTPLERMESIDQSRVLEHDFPLQGVPFSRGYNGINEPHEVEEVEAILAEDPRQQAVFNEVAR